MRRKMEEQINKIPIIIDTDPGCDDAVALMLALKHPLFDVKAITVTAGNHTLEKTTNNACQVCSYLDITNIPIAAGMGQPIIKNPVDYINDQIVLENLTFQDSLVQIDPRHAVNVIIDTLMKSEINITFVSIGPLTNLAMAIRLEPKIISKIKQIILIGGSFALGNITPAAEFNIYSDPEAAHIIFTSGRPIVMIGLAITEKVSINKEIIAKIGSVQNKAAALFLDLAEFLTKTSKKESDFGIDPLYDPAAIVYLIKPSLFKTKPMYVEIELKSELSYGRTHCDYYGVNNRPANADVVIDLDSEGFWEVIYETLKRYG